MRNFKNHANSNYFELQSLFRTVLQCREDNSGFVWLYRVFWPVLFLLLLNEDQRTLNGKSFNWNFWEL